MGEKCIHQLTQSSEVKKDIIIIIVCVDEEEEEANNNCQVKSPVEKWSLLFLKRVLALT